MRKIFFLSIFFLFAVIISTKTTPLIFAKTNGQEIFSETDSYTLYRETRIRPFSNQFTIKYPSDWMVDETPISIKFFKKVSDEESEKVSIEVVDFNIADVPGGVTLAKHKQSVLRQSEFDPQFKLLEIKDTYVCNQEAYFVIYEGELKRRIHQISPKKTSHYVETHFFKSKTYVFIYNNALYKVKFYASGSDWQRARDLYDQYIKTVDPSLKSIRFKKYGDT